MIELFVALGGMYNLTMSFGKIFGLKLGLY